MDVFSVDKEGANCKKKLIWMREINENFHLEREREIERDIESEKRKRDVYHSKLSMQSMRVFSN